MPLPLRHQWETSNSNVTYEHWLESELYKRLAYEEAKILQSGEAPAQQLKAEIAALETKLADAINNCSWKEVRCIGDKMRQLSAI